mgnify:CR=1 FL=1
MPALPPGAIQVTDAAVSRIKAQMAKKETVIGIRLYIKDGKGCGGSEYAMEFVEDSPEGHDKLEKDGAVLFIPMMDSFRLFGTLIDYGEDEIGTAKFLFNNPNETGKCGCGESVSFDTAFVDTQPK